MAKNISMKKPEFYVKKMLKLEDDVVKEGRKFCRANKVPFHKAHEVIVREAMREAVNYGAIPIFKEYIKEQRGLLKWKKNKTT